LATLAAQPEDSLGHDYYRLIIDNKFDLEVLDREAIGLGRLPPALAYLNTRILQMHDIWHLAGGYETTALHEVAISSFQLGQFGHNYSAMFLAVVVASGRFAFPSGLTVLLQVMAEAWRHSRTTPSFMAIPWEAEWHRPLAALRVKFGIEPYRSLIPADLVEQSRGQAA
jgi:ubiquinone biosynthesis protein Coq4